MSVVSSRLLLAPLILLATACFPDVNAQIQQANASVARAVQAAQTGQVSGTLNVNATPYPAIRCSAGQANGFNGVDVYGSDGSRIRFVAEVDGTSSVIYFTPAAGAAGVTMKGCSTLNVRPSGVVVNGVAMVNGNAKVACQAGAVRIDGFIGFGCG